MKVVVYSIKEFEKEFLVRANQKQHDITLISNPLSLETALYAEGKDAVVVSNNDEVSSEIIDKLADLGIRYITTRSVAVDHIDREAAGRRNIKLANIPSYSAEAVAEYSVLLALSLNRKIVPTVNSSRQFDFRVENHVGFNFFGKTVGVIGLGNIGQAVARIYKSMGCRVLGYDPKFPGHLSYVEKNSLDGLYEESDIISLHLPLSPESKNMINQQSLSKMKQGVMLINTCSGKLINTTDLLRCLRSGKIGYLALDGYEFERGLFFEDHSKNQTKDSMMEELLSFPNVIISPHQAFLTSEGLQEVANLTIKNLDNWQAGKCSGKACVCADGCRKVSLKA